MHYLQFYPVFNGFPSNWYSNMQIRRLFHLESLKISVEVVARPSEKWMPVIETLTEELPTFESHTFYGSIR